MYGWIREAEKELNIEFVPPLISALSILYYHQDEIFEYIADDVKVSQDKKSITKINECNWQNNSYGIIEISSMSNIICKWDLRITSLKDSANLIMGVSSIQVLNDDFEDHSGIHYAIWDDGELNDCGEWISRSLGTEIVEGDQVSIILDLPKAQFRVSVNGGEDIMAFENIERKEKVKYKLMVSMYGPQTAVQILNCLRL